MESNKQYKIPKFDEDKRTFETRVTFIHDLFAALHTRDQIMARCISHKLDSSFEAYLKKIHRSLWVLDGQDPLEVLTRIDK